MVLIEIKMLIINQYNCDKSVSGLCKYEAVLLSHVLWGNIMVTFQGYKYVGCPAWVTYTRVKLFYSAHLLSFYKLSVPFPKFRKQALIPRICIPGDGLFQPSKKKNNNNIS